MSFSSDIQKCTWSNLGCIVLQSKTSTILNNWQWITIKKIIIMRTTGISKWPPVVHMPTRINLRKAHADCGTEGQHLGQKHRCQDHAFYSEVEHFILFCIISVEWFKMPRYNEISSQGQHLFCQRFRSIRIQLTNL